MGDYTKLIVNCSVSKTDDIEELENKIKEILRFSSSAYHCGGELIHIDNDWHHRTDITIVTQCKYSKSIPEFIDWLKPQVIDGMGEEAAFAVSFTEYQKEPTVYYK